MQLWKKEVSPSPAHVEPSKDPVSPLCPQEPDDGLPSLLRPKVVILLALCTHLSRETRDLKKKVSQELHTGASDPPVLVKQPLLQDREEELHCGICITVDHSLSCLQRCVTDEL